MLIFRGFLALKLSCICTSMLHPACRHEESRNCWPLWSDEGFFEKGKDKG